MFWSRLKVRGCGANYTESHRGGSILGFPRQRLTHLLQRLARTCYKRIQISSGVQGLADAFMMMGLLFESETAQRLNLDIFETIYFAACEASCELAA